MLLLDAASGSSDRPRGAPSSRAPYYRRPHTGEETRLSRRAYERRSFAAGVVAMSLAAIMGAKHAAKAIKLKAKAADARARVRWEPDLLPREASGRRTV